MTSVDFLGLRDEIAKACRVMAALGLVEHVLGHISARVSDDMFLVRCRGPREAGLAATTVEDIRAVPFEGDRVLDGWRTPNELPIHVQLLGRRPEVSAVVHAHPPAVVVFSLLQRPLEPLYGAYDIPGARLAAGGIPVWPRSALIASDDLAASMADAMGDRPAVILRGHGIVTVGSGPPAQAVAEAVLVAHAVDRLARHTLAVLQAGGEPNPIAAEDLASLPDLGAGFNVSVLWRHALTQIDGATATV